MKSRRHFTLIAEKKGEKAHKEAIAMGLKYGGFGYWKDPQTGETTHKTENDQLVPVEAEQESELADKRGEDGGGGLPGMGPAVDKKDAGRGATQQPRGPGTVSLGQKVGTAEPGEEQVHDRQTWVPGPDGDHCVDSEHPPGDIPDDAFVGKTNYYQWTSGPDGTNFQNVSYDNIMKAGREQSGAQAPPGGMQEETDPDGARTMMGKIMARKTPGESERTMRDANQAVKKLGQHDDSQGNNPALARQVASMIRIRDRGKDYTDQSTGAQEQGKAADMWRKGLKLPAIAKDVDAVKAMNDEAKKLVKDPDFDMDMEDAFGGGLFGQVGFSKTDPNVVIKKGGIGPDELKALWAMRNNPGFPTLINAEFDEPFGHQSSEKNNRYNDPASRRGPQEKDYWDPDEASDFEDRFPTAYGTFAMSAASGIPLSDVLTGEDDYAEGGSEEMNKLRRELWGLRGSLHKQGFSHNDMHGGNVFVDEDMKPTILDLGLAKDDPVSALMEALGSVGDGMTDSPYEDYQLSDNMRFDRLPESMRQTLLDNRSDLEELLSESGGYEGDDEDQKFETIQDFLRGGIRMTGKDLDSFREIFPRLGDGKFVKQLIERLYRGIGGTELERRMSNAFDQRQKDSKLIAVANKIRRAKGKKDISVKNKNVIPPKNIDFDD